MKEKVYGSVLPLTSICDAWTSRSSLIFLISMKERPFPFQVMRWSHLFPSASLTLLFIRLKTCQVKGRLPRTILPRIMCNLFQTILSRTTTYWNVRGTFVFGKRNNISAFRFHAELLLFFNLCGFRWFFFKISAGNLNDLTQDSSL